MKLTIKAREFLLNLANGQFDGRTPVFWVLREMGWIATADGPSDFYVTTAGRDALGDEDD